MEILLPVITLSILGLAFGIGLAYASKIFFVKTNPKVGKILAVLPGSNCGACGFAGCSALAEALSKGDVNVETCIPGGHQVHEKVADILGTKAEVKKRMAATLICNGGKRTPDKFLYNGPQDCIAANMYLKGQKACEFGCLGFGTCVRSCPFGAMRMAENNLPVIDQNRCTGCGKCIQVCPQKILILRPAKSHIWVACNSTDNGATVMKVCGHGCIGCMKCVAVCKISAISLGGSVTHCDGDAIKVIDNLARIDYNKCTNCRQCVEVCPTKVIKTDNRI
jgi:electron transport complex protein RnfB